MANRNSINLTFPEYLQTVSTLADLRAFSVNKVKANDVVCVTGRNVYNDGAGAFYLWDPFDTRSETTDAIIRPTAQSGAGRWVRINGASIGPTGATGATGATGPQGIQGPQGPIGDNSAALAAADTANASAAGANAATANANSAAAQIQLSNGPSLLIEPASGTFPSLDDTYFAGAKSIYTRFDGVRQQLIGFQDATDFTRTTTGTYVDSNGNVQTAAANVARLNYRLVNGSWVLGGLLLEPQATNQVINSVMAGTVAGTPGTPPTSWNIIGSVNGITRQIVGTGTQNGIQYIDLRYSGTATANGNISIYPQNYAATVGQTWTGSMWAALVGGTLPASGFVEVVNETGPTTPQYTTTPFNPTATFARRSLTRTMTISDTNRTQYYLQCSYSTGGVLDFTIRIGGFQMETGQTFSSYIPTTTATVTRTGDQPSKTMGPEFNPAAQTAMFSFIVPQGAIGAVDDLVMYGWLDGTSGYSYRVFYRNSVKRLFAFMSLNGTQVAVQGPVLTPGTTCKVAFGFQGKLIRMSVNGASMTDATNSFVGNYPAFSVRRIGWFNTNGQATTMVMPYLPHPTNSLLDTSEYPRLLSLAEMNVYTS